MMKKDTIVALSTAWGTGAIALIRVSGDEALEMTQHIFESRKATPLAQLNSHTLHFGHIVETTAENKTIIDEVLVAIFKKPHSFTKENMVEISCHASPYIIQTILQLYSKMGARYAKAGEFTQRAYLNGRFDLAQAEAIADLIAADSEAAHRLAINQLRGGYSTTIKTMRNDFIQLAALLELELDFSEEDVEFADRTELQKQINTLEITIKQLAESFRTGNALKNGIPIAIVGKPNAGKSTLLNALLNEEKAIVSDIPGTTRDTIEDILIVEGIKFRLIDTAGLRPTNDTIEALGIERAKQKMNQAALILYVIDTTTHTITEAKEEIQNLQKEFKNEYLLVANKTETLNSKELEAWQNAFENSLVLISAIEKKGLENLQNKMLEMTLKDGFDKDKTIVTNIRHYESLLQTLEALEKAKNNIAKQVSTELIASDIRTAIYHLGAIVGEINNEDLLDFIFSKFCIGK